MPSPTEGNGEDEDDDDDAVREAPADEQPVLRAQRRAKDKVLKNMKAFFEAESDESGSDGLD